jgi:peptidylprolyl isomerase
MSTLVVACNDKYPDLPEGIYAEFVTNQGTFVAKLYNKATPLTAANFVSLAEGTNPLVDSAYAGKPYYNGLIFHRVIADFMIQGGDPNGDGSGNPGYRFPDEIVDSLKHSRKGILSMANSGPETNGSQFFITLKETPWLDGKHTVFGEIVIGQDVVDSIGLVPTEKPGDRPVTPVVMEQVNIIRKGGASVADFATEMQRMEAEREARRKKLERMAIDQAVMFANLRNQAEETESGLRIFYNKRGEGKKPGNSDLLLIDYAGFFQNGELFTTNRKEVAERYDIFDHTMEARGGYSPMKTSIDEPRLIQGFREALGMLKVGDQVTVFIPSDLAYGQQGNRGIPPDTDLIFEMELVDIQQP